MEVWKMEYESLLNSETSSFSDVCNLINKITPKKLYKYGSFNSYWKDMILKGNFHMKNPADYNDPFDSSIYYNDNELIHYLKNTIPEYKQVALISKEHKEACNQIIMEELPHLKTSVEIIYKYAFRICCFSELNDSILMWSHYAQNHTGFCIEFDTSRFTEILLPIIYSDKIYKIKPSGESFLTSTKSGFLNPILYKSMIWDYEKEWRLIVENINFQNVADESGYLINLSQSISAIYFGVKTKIPKYLFTWAREHNIRLFQMHLHKTNYKLMAKSIDLSSGCESDGI